MPRRSPRKSGASNPPKEKDEDEEYVVEDEDEVVEDGDKHVEEEDESMEEDEEFTGDEYFDTDGNSIHEEKKLSLKTFTLSQRSPTRRYLLVLDLARFMGYHDSFRFMKIFPTLPRVNIEQSEREELIEQGVVHPIMKFRNVPVVSVVGAYKMFGDKLLEAPKDFSGHQSVDSLEPSGDYGEEDEFEAIRRNRAIKEAAVLDLKEPSIVERENGDWIYNCAVAAAKYNAMLRSERMDRLWGDEEIVDEHAPIGHGHKEKRKRFKEYSDDEEFDISDDEDTTGDQQQSSGANRRRQYRKKTGFYDVHTNITQVPVNTQISNVTVEMLPPSFEDLKKKPAQIKDLNFVYSPGEKLVRDPQSSLSYWLGPAYSVTTCDKYPVSLIPGQYQGVYSM